MELPKVKLKPSILKKPSDTTDTQVKTKIKPIILKKDLLIDIDIPTIDNGITKVTRPDVQIKRLINDLFQHTTIQTTLSSVIASKCLKPNINELIHTVKGIAMGAHNLLNLHLLRCISLRLSLPDLKSQNLYSHVCRLVSKLNGHFDDPNDVPKDLLDSAQIYRDLHPHDFPYPDRKSIGLVVNTLAARIQTEVANHFNTNIEGRFSRYLLNRYGIRDQYQRLHIVRRVLYSSRHPSKFDFRLQNLILISIYTSKLFGNKKIPKDTNPFDATECFIPFYHHMQSDCTQDNTKQFSLLPLTSQFIPDYVEITTSLLPDIFNRWTGTTKDTYRQMGVESQWQMLLNMKSLPKCGKGYFANNIRTNGYAVSMLYYTMPADFPVGFNEFKELAIEAKIAFLKEYKKSVEKRKAEHKAKQKSLTTEEIEEIQCPYSESDFQYHYGNDPGGRYLYTIDTGEGKRTIRASAKEYYHLTHSRSYRKLLKTRALKVPELQSLTKCSLKVSVYQTFINHLREWLRLSLNILSEYKKMIYRKQKFTVYTHRQEAFYKLSNKIIQGRDPSKIIIGWGNGCSNQKGIKGNHLPNKAFKNFIIKTTDLILVDIDEYRTTKCCSKCGKETKQIWTKESSENMERYRRAIYAITRCPNNDCQITWERDINASTNIRKVLIHKLKKISRPDYLQRKKSGMVTKLEVSNALSVPIKEHTLSLVKKVVGMGTLLKDGNQAIHKKT